MLMTHKIHKQNAYICSFPQTQTGHCSLCVSEHPRARHESHKRGHQRPPLTTAASVPEQEKCNYHPNKKSCTLPYVDILIP